MDLVRHAELGVIDIETRESIFVFLGFPAQGAASALAAAPKQRCSGNQPTTYRGE